MKPNSRRGLSLLEVILSIAILGTALATIGQLIRIGGRNAIMARDLAMAQIYAETTLNEVACGAIEPTAGGGPLDDLGEWVYDLQVDTGDQENMLTVKVTVSQDPEQYARPITFSMSRWIIDPVFVEEAAAKEVEMKALFAEAQKAATATPMAESTGTDPAAAAAAPGSLVGAIPATTGQGAQGAPGGKGGKGGKGGDQGGKGGARGGKGGQDGQGGPGGGRGGKGGQDGQGGTGGQKGPGGQNPQDQGQRPTQGPKNQQPTNNRPTNNTKGPTGPGNFQQPGQGKGG